MRYGINNVIITVKGAKRNENTKNNIKYTDKL